MRAGLNSNPPCISSASGVAEKEFRAKGIRHSHVHSYRAGNGLWLRVGTNILEEYSASIFRVEVTMDTSWSSKVLVN